MRSLWYLASPYYHVRSEVRDSRARAVAIIAGELLEKGVHIFSPIAHGHAIHTHRPLKWESEDWLRYDEIYLKISCGIFLAEIPGWEKSKGVAWEVDWAKANNLVVTHIPSNDVHSIIGPELYEACLG